MRYQDYVFLNGKFIGAFDEMYEESLVVPWHQDERAYELNSDIDIAIIKKYSNGSICDIGCGLGYFANRVYNEINATVTGIDISKVAIDKAKKLFPNIKFLHGNILHDNSDTLGIYDFVIAKGIIWYVCSKWGDFLNNVKSMINGGNYIYISQPFPPESTWTFQDIIESPEALIHKLTQKFAPIYWSIDQEMKFSGRETVRFLGVPRKE